jgi:hypothetical protein
MAAVSERLSRPPRNIASAQFAARKESAVFSASAFQNRPGRFRLNAGDLRRSAGDIRLSAGGIRLSAGDIRLSAGDIGLSAGDIRLSANDIRLHASKSRLHVKKACLHVKSRLERGVRVRLSTTSLAALFFRACFLRASNAVETIPRRLAYVNRLSSKKSAEAS